MNSELFWPLSNAIKNMTPKNTRTTARAAGPVQQTTAMAAASALDAGDAANPLPAYSASLSSGASTCVSLPLDGTAYLEVSSAAGTPTVTVQDGSGKTVESTATSARSGEQTVTTSCEIQPLAPGIHGVNVSLPPGDSGEVVLTGIVVGGSRLAVAAGAPAFAGREVTLTATLVDGLSTVPPGGAMTGVVNLGPGTDTALSFRDNGTGEDLVADDGVFTAVFTPSAPGRWLASVDVRHPSAHRVANLVFDVGRAPATVTAPPVEMTTPGPGVTYASFGIGVPIEVSEDGTYTVSAVLSDDAGVEIGVLRGTTWLKSAEPTTLVAALAGEELAGIVPGRLSVSPVRITYHHDGVELPAGSGPGLTTSRAYSRTDFYAFSISLLGPTANPSPTSAVRFSGTALNTSSTVAAIEYSIDGSATWHAAAPSDGDFDSHSEDFSIDLELPDYVYGILVRQTGADGTQLPVADWAGKRFTVDTVAPAKIADLAAVLTTETGSPVARTSWLPSDPPSDTASPVRYVVTLDGGDAVTTYDTGAGITLANARIQTLSVIPIDEAGNTGPESTVTVDATLLDMTAPSTGLRSDPSSNAAGWNKSSVSVSLDATDGPAGSGVADTRYAVDAHATESYAHAFSVDTEGQHTIEYSSVDMAGNSEDTRTATIWIDLTPPVTTSDATATYGGTATIEFDADDGSLSGVAKTEWRLDAASGWASGTVASVSTAGEHTVYFRSTDTAGNVEDTKSRTFVVRYPSVVSLTSTSSPSLAYGSAFTVAGTLKTGAVGLPVQRVILQSGAPGGAFSDTSLTTTTTLTGGFTFSVRPMTKTYYRVRFAGSTGYAASDSTASVYATPKAYVRTPVAPSKMSKSKSYTVYGYLKPRHTSGSYPVRIYKYRKLSSGKWKSYGYSKSKASNYTSYTKYSVKMTLTRAGKWRLRAYAPADSGHAKAWSSGYDYVTVK